MDTSYNTLFSVLIANYNNGKYLTEAIESVKNQTYPNWEIIIVDDCSTDNSFEIYKNLGYDTRIHVFINECHHGCGYTKSRCVESANGEICGFLDSDDALVDNAIELMVKTHAEKPTASLIYSKMYICDSNLNRHNGVASNSLIPQGDTFLEYGNGAVSHFATFKLNLYKQTAGISLDLQRAVDHDLYYKMEEVGNLVFLNQCLYYYRTGTNCNISLGSGELKAAMWDIIAQVDACRRRKINIEDIVYKDFLSIFKCKMEIAEQYKQLYYNIERSKAYLLWKLMTTPYNYIRSIMGNSR